jgi:hypothetical protein
VIGARGHRSARSSRDRRSDGTDIPRNDGSRERMVIDLGGDVIRGVLGTLMGGSRRRR